MNRAVVLLLVLAACGAPPAPAPEIASTAAVEPAPAAVEDELCCCTFDSAIPEDFPYVNTWDSLASTCSTGDGERMPGQCIAWSWCGYADGDAPRSLAQRHDLAPAPPMPDGSCCCDIWDGHGETFHVLEAGTCALQPYASCVDDGFC